jgi:hypothetical protein
MIDTDCIHGELRHPCHFCNLQCSQELFKQMGARRDGNFQIISGRMTFLAILIIKKT